MIVFYLCGLFLNKKNGKFSSDVLPILSLCYDHGLCLVEIWRHIIELRPYGELVYTILQGFEYIISVLMTRLDGGVITKRDDIIQG